MGLGLNDNGLETGRVLRKGRQPGPAPVPSHPLPVMLGPATHGILHAVCRREETSWGDGVQDGEPEAAGPLPTDSSSLLPRCLPKARKDAEALQYTLLKFPKCSC